MMYHAILAKRLKKRLGNYKGNTLKKLTALTCDVRATIRHVSITIQLKTCNCDTYKTIKKKTIDISSIEKYS